MSDLYLEDGVDMAHESNTLEADAAQEIRDSLANLHVCPFCGALKDQPEAQCGRCTMENTSATRQATKARIGPWYVMQTRNPAAPGMRFETLLAFVRKGRIKPRSIVRGPTTHQLWRFAAQIKGLSREFGVCYSCGGAIERVANLCSHCNRLQEPPINPNAFIEGQEIEAVPASIPVFREIPSPPVVGEDIVVPALGAAQAREAEYQAAEETDDSKRKGDGFLSARDLAAAFKLNFNGSEPAPSSSPAVATPARRRAASPRGAVPRRRRRWGRLVLLLLLLGAAVFAFQLRRDASLRARTADWYARGVAWVQQQWKSIKETSAKSEHHVPPARLGAAVIPDASAVTPQNSPATQPSKWDQLFAQPATDAKAPAKHE